MYTDIPLWLSSIFLVIGLFALAKSSDVFVAGAAALAHGLGVSSFVIGMVVVGFGTSAPELLVSMFSGASGHTNLSLGNAYGSCIFNIVGILGVAALISPLVVKRSIRLVAVPLLSLIAVGSYMLLRDYRLDRLDAVALLVAFFIIMPLYCWFDGAKTETPPDNSSAISMSKAVLLTIIGLVVMIAASHVLVWGAVDMAKALGVSDLLIGLTVVAIGTSLPELASAVAAARRRESELVLGNIVGSNLFNMLAVIGIAGTISPSDGFSKYILSRDLPLLLFVTVSICLFSRRNKDSANFVVTRRFGVVWILIFFAYMTLTVMQEAF